MQMIECLTEIRHAAESIISLIWAEHEAAEESAAKLHRLRNETEAGYRQAAALNDFDDDEGLATAIYWDTYFRPDKDRFHAAAALEKLQALWEIRAYSRSALSSSLLQFAKQGISIVHGDRIMAGRIVEGRPLTEVIWEGRNQALHWEDGKPHARVISVFECLSQRHQMFADFKARNLAFDVVWLLGWRDWPSFEADLRSLSEATSAAQS